MKKIITFSAALVLGVCAFGVTRNVRAANASAPLDDDQVVAMKAMMGKYIGSLGRYTKKSRIFVDKDVTGYDAKIFHAGHDVLERTTYYNGTAGLLMGNLDGTFGPINSGYANDGAGNMIHFRTEDGLAGLTSSNRTIDYTVTGKTMSDYFYNLNDLINSIEAGDWGYNSTDKNYYHDIDDLTVDVNGDYNDKILKKFQYFAAPMLLQDGAEHYLSPKSIVVDEIAGYLHICIYASNGDVDKLSSGSNLLAESKVYADFVEPGYYLVGSFGGSYDWQIAGGRQLLAPSEGTDIGQISGMPIDADTKLQICRLKADGDTEWIHDTPSIGDYRFAEMDGNDIKIKYSGSYAVFLNSESKIYFSRLNAKSITITTDISNISWGEKFAIHIWTTESGDIGSWGNENQRMQLVSGNTYTYSFSYFGTVEGLIFYFYQNSVTKQTENIKGSNLFKNDDSLTINIGSSLTWGSGDEANTIKSGITLITN